jgi:hypothetical protein
MINTLSLLVALAAWSGTIEHRTSFGSMTLIQEEWTRDPETPPIMHAPDAWTKLHLRWEAPGGDVEVELLDDGRILQIGVRGYECLRAATFYHYAQRVGEPALWQDMARQLDALTKACPRVPTARRAALVREFAGTRDDFVPGVEALKKRAATVVARTLKRCSFPRTPKGTVVIAPDPYRTLCGPLW